MQQNDASSGSRLQFDTTARDELLERWVEQPPVDPHVQYLRDAERTAALDQLGRREHVLDLASESTLTRELAANAGTGGVTRLDFSEPAGDHASEVLGDTVDRYATTEPERPELPFADDTFDGAVCIGPYDWKFLKVDRLMAELRRVVTDDALVVFSVPTTRSPYRPDNRDYVQYFETEEALGILSTDWRLVDRDLLFQYPYPLHGLIGQFLSTETQERLVDVAERLSEEFTARDRWDLASYLVLGSTPMDYERYVTDAVDCLFRPAEENGFWDGDEGKIIRALDYDLHGTGDRPEFSWVPDDSVQWRYAPFALMGTMRWRASELADDRHDDRIRRQLSYFAEGFEDEATRNEMPSYAVGPLTMSFAVAADVFGEGGDENANDKDSDGAHESYLATGRAMYEHAAGRFDFSHSEDALLLFGWAHLYDVDPDETLRDDITAALWELNDHFTSDRLFEFDNPTSRRHQNQMYALWGLCEAARVTGLDGYLDTAEQVLDYTIEERMRDDGAFIWEDVRFRARAVDSAAMRYLDRRPPHWEFLYECHQTFFVNAVASYYEAGGDRDYTRAVREAMSWIYGDNALEQNLHDATGLGVPPRFLTITDERMDVPDQMFKGSYEVGSYVMALTRLLDGPFE